MKLFGLLGLVAAVVCAHPTTAAADNWIDLFANLPVESLDRMSLQARLDEIGKAQTRVGDEP